MSVYGIDFIKAPDGRYFLSEINGIKSGTGGFEKIYGDTRVRDKIVDMLLEKHGDLSYNSGKYMHDDWGKRHPKKAAAIRAIINNKMGHTALSYLVKKIQTVTKPSWSDSELAENDWLVEDEAASSAVKVEEAWPVAYDIPEYEGQNAAVINLANEIIPGTLVNHYVTEEACRNKFIQYLLLKDTDISKHVIESTLVGLGTTDEETIDNMLTRHNKFVVKPILGLQGIGVKFMSAEDVRKKYVGSSGPVSKNLSLLDLKLAMSHKEPIMLEDYVKKLEFLFEYSLSVLQPFVNSRTRKNSQYNSIRAIVCNNTFVDAYMRVSNSKCVNLSKDADARTFNHDADFRSLCEKTVAALEEKTHPIQRKEYKAIIYLKYLEWVRKNNEKFGYVQNPRFDELENRSFLKSYMMFYPTVANHIIAIASGKLKKF